MTDLPFKLTFTAIPFRGTRDDALNAYHPEINITDPESSRFGSSPDSPSQRWVAVLFNEAETEFLLKIAAMVEADGWVSEEGRTFAGRLAAVVQACVTDFAGYEERKAADLPASTPVTS